MYHRHSRMDYLRESSSSNALYPMRFVWLYGGGRVHLCGSFTGWRQCPMSPVEGSPTVFQIVCSLPPGIHQYKFVVDGECRHDEHLPYISCNYGTVNTIFLPREHDYLPTFPSPQITLGSNMDVDNEVKSLVQLTDGSLSKTIPTISGADLDISHQRISAFLSKHTAYELLPASGKVIALDVDVPLKQAFHKLHEEGIPMAPLFDFCKGQYVGILSALDFILIMKQLRSRGSNMTEEELETHTISAWKKAKSYISRQSNKCERASPRQLVQAGPNLNLQDVALKILQNGVSAIPILHSTSLEGAYPLLLHLTSLADVLKSICRYFRFSLGSLPMLQLPICVIPLGTWAPKIGQSNQNPLAMLRPNSSLTAALDLLVQAQVSSIPIVDDNGALLDVYSRSDITALAKDNHFARINLDETTIHQALKLREESYYTSGWSQQRCQMCLPTDPVYSVMERLSKPGVRRLIIVEAGSKRVEGIVSVSDVFRLLVG